VPASVPKLGPRTVIREPRPTNDPIKNGPEIFNFRITRLALSSDKSTRGYFHGTSACLSALFTAGRYEELIDS
jgi:hypothetical protein